MRRVVYFTDANGFGGAEIATLALIRGLDRDQWEPSIVFHPSPRNEPLAEAARDLGVEVHGVPRMPPRRRGIRGVGRFVRLLRSERPAILHVALSWPLAAKMALLFGVPLARVPGVVTTAHLWLDVEPTSRVLVQQRLIAANVDRLIAVSEHTARQFREQLRWPADKIEVIPNGVDTRALRRDRSPELRRELTGPEDRPVLLCPARLDPQKGHAHLLAALPRLPEVILALAGTGELQPTLEVQASELGVRDRVRFLGLRFDVPELMAASDIVVLPSLFEGLPIVPLEAMAAGRPVVATRIGGTDEAILDGETGLLVPPEDPPALAAAIRFLLEEPQRSARMGEHGRLHVARRFDLATMVARTTALYTEVLDGRHR